MLRLHFLPRFDRAYKKFTKRNEERSGAIDKALRMFAADPKHPSLNIEKLGGSDIWTIRIDRGNRLFFVWEDESAVFFFVGSHDSYRTVGK